MKTRLCVPSARPAGRTWPRLFTVPWDAHRSPVLELFSHHVLIFRFLPIFETLPLHGHARICQPQGPQHWETWWRSSVFNLSPLRDTDTYCRLPRDASQPQSCFCSSAFWPALSEAPASQLHFVLVIMVVHDTEQLFLGHRGPLLGWLSLMETLGLAEGLRVLQGA